MEVMVQLIYLSLFGTISSTGVYFKNPSGKYATALMLLICKFNPNNIWTNGRFDSFQMLEVTIQIQANKNVVWFNLTHSTQC